MFYPMIFKPVYKDYIWGGRRLGAFGKELPNEGKVAESWEIASHPDGESTVVNGPHVGKTLTQLLEEYGRELSGKDLPEDKIAKFPLLVKLIDANDSLSVQVHPDDEFARLNENGELGKSEMWYILQADPDSKLIYGLKQGVTKESFAQAVKEGKINQCLNYISVKAGDFVNIPAGLLHAIGKGIVLAEIQQNSNTTYRVYDYDRKDKDGNTRELHIEKALEVIDFDTEKQEGILPGLTVRHEGMTKTYMVANEYFCVEKLCVDGSWEEVDEGSRFNIIIVLDGKGSLITKGNNPVELKQASSILLPAASDKFEIQGDVKLLRAYVPDIEKDILKPLQDLGYSQEEITNKIAGLKY